MNILFSCLSVVRHSHVHLMLWSRRWCTHVVYVIIPDDITPPQQQQERRRVFIFRTISTISWLAAATGWINEVVSCRICTRISPAQPLFPDSKGMRWGSADSKGSPPCKKKRTSTRHPPKHQDLFQCALPFTHAAAVMDEWGIDLF